MSNELKAFLDECERTPEIQGVILTGSAGRGDGDDYSDVDIVLLTLRPIEGIPEGRLVRGDVMLDVRFVPWDAFRAVEWSMSMYFAYLFGKIMYDPTGQVVVFIEKQRGEWRNFCFRSLCLDFASVGFIQSMDTPWRGLGGGGDTHFDKFLQREDYVSAHRLLTKTLEYLFELVYLANSVPVPDYKNSFRCLSLASWLPQGFVASIDQIIKTHELTEDALRGKSKILARILEEIQIYAEQMFELPPDLYAYHLTNRYVA